jgi:EAL and modified HD-GYP domain-containing signal transduction protein
MTFGIDALTGGRKAHINFTQNHLRDELPAIFPKEHLVVEILETVEPTEELIAAIRNLKNAGYTIALDDFKYHPRLDALARLADIIKVDFMACASAERRDIVRRLGGAGIRFLAEKVETNEEFAEAGDLGYTLFQGYFFAKPQIMKGKEIPGFKLNYIEMLREVNAPDFDFNKVEAIVKRDLSLSYKFLRFINSAHFGFRAEVTSIRHALTILGTKGARTWLSLMALTALGEDKPRELVVTALVRALFLERLADEAKMRENGADLFLIGLFSVIDAILDQPMEAIVSDLPLAAPVKEALTGRPNRHREFFEIMLDYEHGDWRRFSEACRRAGLDESPLPGIYLKAVTEATEVERELNR